MKKVKKNRIEVYVMIYRGTTGPFTSSDYPQAWGSLSGAEKYFHKIPEEKRPMYRIGRFELTHTVEPVEP